jgi:hypothetical protein
LAKAGKSTSGTLELQFDGALFDQILKGTGDASVSFPRLDGTEAVLGLAPRGSNSAASDARVYFTDGKSERRATYPEPESLVGWIEGEPGSSVLITRLGDRYFGTVMGATGGALSVAPAGKKSAGLSTLSAGTGLPVPARFCQTLEAPGVTSSADKGVAAPDGEPASVRPIRIAVEAAYDLYKELDFDEVETAAYSAALMEAVAVIYERDLQAELQISGIRVWTTHRQPYLGTASGGLEGAVGMVKANRYPASMLNSNLIHVLGSKGNRGGVAYLDTLQYCGSSLEDTTTTPIRSYQTGFSDIYAIYSYPTNSYSWDVNVVAHELGHNFGSPHTHCYSPPIDRCYNEIGCSSGAVVARQGTIMSYCHLVASTRLEFSPREIDRLRQGVAVASCLTEKVTVEPDTPIANQSVTIRYDPTDSVLASANNIYLYWGTNEFTPVGPLLGPGGVLPDGRREFSLAVPGSAFALNFLFNNNAGTWDNNQFFDWRRAVDTGNPPPAFPYSDPVTVVPDLPRIRQSLAISYNPAGRSLAAAGTVNLYYGRNGWDSPQTIAMTRTAAGQPWSATLNIPADWRSVEMVFNNGAGTWDSNDGYDWHFRTVASQVDWVLE